MSRPLPFTLGPITASPGQTVGGFLDVPAGIDPGTRIPITIVHGAKPGPILALIAGIHGSEPSPILALQRVRAELDAGQLAGTVIMVQIANLPSFTERTIYRGPWDRKNLNRAFPGRADGTASERIAHAITAHVIDRCDYLVDMHSGDGNESLRAYSYWNHLGQDERVDGIARDMALAFGIDHIVIDRGRPRDLKATVFCSNTAHARGKPAVTTEAGGVGVPTDEMIALNVTGAFGVMRHFKMVAGQPDIVAAPRWIDPSDVYYSPETGLWYPAVRADQHITKGTLLGRLTDYFGAPLTDVRSTLDGVVLYVVVSPAMAAGEPVAMVGTFARP